MTVRPELIEMHSSWCVVHDGLWDDNETECNRTWIDDDLGRPHEACVKVPLFRGLAPGESP